MNEVGSIPPEPINARNRAAPFTPTKQAYVTAPSSPLAQQSYPSRAIAQNLAFPAALYLLFEARWLVQSQMEERRRD